jgi:hypothetical protein
LDKIRFKLQELIYINFDLTEIYNLIEIVLSEKQIITYEDLQEKLNEITIQLLDFINEISKYYSENGYNMNLTTTTPALVHALSKSSDWSLFRKGRSKANLKNYSRYGMENKHLTDKESKNRVTYSFNFKKVNK